MSRHVITRAKPFMSVNEVAIVLCVSKATIHRSLKRGDFPISHFVINGTIRFLRKDVDAFLGVRESGLTGTD
ncbi:MAG: helix-turn-helix domain-containing protein [Actinobacteria bacterium]|jgi:predicted DNA-binding transcriptional regulator AlpA|nr:helix-turn-helix domain-containing protein [Actinomycetota bacterium]